MSDKNNQDFPPVYKEIREKIVEHLDKSDPQAEKDEDYIADLEDLLSIIEPLKNLDEESKPGLFRVEGTRIRQKIGGPVGSNRFF